MKQRIAVIFIVVALFLLAGCSEEETASTASSETASASSETASAGVGPVETAAGAVSEEAPGVTEPSAPTEVPATSTPVEPLAAEVNDQPIFLFEFENELARYKQAQLELGLETEEGQSDQQIVLDALIEKELITQAAARMGITVTDETVNQRVTELQEASGGADNFNDWLMTNQWSIDEFKDALRSEIAAEGLVQVVTADVPTAVEQVQARYLQVDDPALAETILEEIKAGAEFADLAKEHSLDRITAESGGDLGFFARGSLLVPEVEAAAFELQAREISEVILGSKADGSGTVYYIVQVTDRDPERTLDANLRFEMLQETFEAWLEEQWMTANITRYVEPNG